MDDIILDGSSMREEKTGFAQWLRFPDSAFPHSPLSSRQGEMMPVLLDSQAVAATIKSLADRIAAELPRDVPAAVVGIRSRGEVLAGRLIRALAARGQRDIAYGTLDITLYRDDLAE